MKEILSTYGRWLAVSLSSASLVILILLLTAGQGRLFGALFVGYAVAAVCIVTLTWRTWHSASLPVSAAKKQMLWGLILRICVIFIVMSLAARIGGQAVFLVAALGLLVGYGLALGLWIRIASRFDGNHKGR